MVKKIIICIVAIIIFEVVLLSGYYLYRVNLVKKSVENRATSIDLAELHSVISEQYVGQSKSSSIVKELINKVKEYNSQAEDDEFEKVFIEGVIFISNTKSEKLYDVEIKDYYDDGYVKTIKIYDHQEAIENGFGDESRRRSFKIVFT